MSTTETLNDGSAAQALADGGAKVLLADIDESAAKRAADDITGETLVWSGNLVSADAPEDMVRTALDAWGGLDIVVNNAGYTLDAPLHKMRDEDFQAMLDIHTIVPFRVIRAAAPAMRDAAKREREEGREVFRKIVNVTSMAAYGNPGQANYASAKAGLIGLTKTVAREWGPLKVCANAVAFGFIDTRLTQTKNADSVIELGGREIAVGVPEQMRQLLPTVVPLGRSGTTAEAAGPIAFLCSSWSDYVTGQVINVGGGVPMGMTA